MAMLQETIPDDSRLQVGLLGKTTSGIKWSAVSQIGGQGVDLVTTVILARLLLPSDFGLMAMAMVVIGLLELFKDLGTSATVIQRENLSQSLLASIFWINVTFGILTTLLIYFLAPTAASFYDDPRVIAVLQALSITFIVSGVSILQRAILLRNFAFHTLAKIEIGATLCGAIVGIGSAFLGAGVWSLVSRSLVNVAVTTVWLWFSTKWRPRLLFDWVEVKSVSAYSLYLTGTNVLDFLERNSDNLIIGKFLGAQALGYYTLAYNLMLYPIRSISWTLGRVMFPVYSRMQDDNLMFGRAYFKIAGAIALVSFPAMIGLMAVSNLLVPTFFGSQWQPVILLLMILAPVGLVQSITTTAGTIYRAKGRTDLEFRWGIGSVVLHVIAFLIGVQWGLIGVAVAYMMVVMILTFPWLAISFRLINLRLRDMGSVLWRPFLSSLFMLATVTLLKGAMPQDIAGGMTLGILITIGSIAYLCFSWMLNRGQILQLYAMIRLRS